MPQKATYPTKGGVADEVGVVNVLLPELEDPPDEFTEITW
jgi:hypothetical protein